MSEADKQKNRELLETILLKLRGCIRTLKGEKEVRKGPYQKATAQETGTSLGFVALVEDLKKHKGILSRGGWFYWLFTSTPTTVGRKKQRR